MANEWVSPTGYNDPNGSWSDEYGAFDGLLTVDHNPAALTSVPAKSWSNFLELTLNSSSDRWSTENAIFCSKIKFLCPYYGTNGINSIDLDVFKNGSWHDVYQGSYLNNVWVEKTNELDPSYVTKMRMRFYNNGSSPVTAAVHEAMFYQVVGIPILTTNAATAVGDGKATLNGNITNTGGEALTTRGFKYKEGIAGEEQDSSDGGYFSTGTYSKNLSGLDPIKKYYFKAYATNSAGTGYGEWKSFGEDIALPTVSSSAATSVKAEQATLNGNMTASGGGDATERGFEWKIGLTGDIETLPETGVFGVGAYSLVLEDLSANILYYFRAYALNGAGTAYGSWLSFTTILTDPTVITHNATDELATQVTGNGEIVKTGGADCDERGFEYGLSKTPTWLKNEAAGGYGKGFFDLTIDGLTPNTEYWYRAYAKRFV